MRTFWFGLIATLWFVATPAAAHSPFNDANALDDAALADARGGFILPGGIDIDLAVRQETRIDGELVLRSSWTLASDGPLVAIEHVSDGVAVSREDEATHARLTVAVPGTDVSHLMGRVNGSIIANTADDRTIATVTTIDIDLSRMAVGSIDSLMPGLGSLASDSAAFRF